MVTRDKVVDDRGRRWVRGDLDSEEYFAHALKKAREAARRDVTKRLLAPIRAPRRAAS